MADNWNRDYGFNYSAQDPAFTREYRTELPSQISVRIRLNQRHAPTDLWRLDDELGKNNMTVSTPKRAPRGDPVIIVSGHPPHSNFNRDSVLAIVRSCYNGAQFA